MTSTKATQKRLPSTKQGTSSRRADYYAGFSLDFARVVIRDLRRAKKTPVLDPWNGGGTTTLAAVEAALPAIGVDLNPAACVIASAKLFRVPPQRQVVRRASWPPAPDGEVAVDEALLPWLVRDDCARVRGVLNEVQLRNGLGAGSLRDQLQNLISARAACRYVVDMASDIRAQVGQTCRNPTWDRAPRTPLALDWTRIRMPATQHELPDIKRVTIMLADARSLPLEDGTVGAIVTSPPYCTRIDYARYTLFLNAMLGLGGETAGYNQLRRSLMGTTALRADADEVALPDEIEALVRRVTEHPSTGSRRYYGRQYRQYFVDAMKSAQEMARVLKPGGTIHLVVQGSYYKEIVIDLPSLYASILATCGLTSVQVSTTPASDFFARIHRGRAGFPETRAYSEAVLVAHRD